MVNERDEKALVASEAPSRVPKRYSLCRPFYQPAAGNVATTDAGSAGVVPAGAPIEPANQPTVSVDHSKIVALAEALLAMRLDQERNPGVDGHDGARQPPVGPPTGRILHPDMAAAMGGVQHHPGQLEHHPSPQNGLDGGQALHQNHPLDQPGLRQHLGSPADQIPRDHVPQMQQPLPIGLHQQERPRGLPPAGLPRMFGAAAAMSRNRPPGFFRGQQQQVRILQRPPTPPRLRLAGMMPGQTAPRDDLPMQALAHALGRPLMAAHVPSVRCQPAVLRQFSPRGEFAFGHDGEAQMGHPGMPSMYVPHMSGQFGPRTQWAKPGELSPTYGPPQFPPRGAEPLRFAPRNQPASPDMLPPRGYPGMALQFSVRGPPAERPRFAPRGQMMTPGAQPPMGQPTRPTQFVPRSQGPANEAPPNCRPPMPAQYSPRGHPAMPGQFGPPRVFPSSMPRHDTPSTRPMQPAQFAGRGQRGLLGAGPVLPHPRGPFYRGQPMKAVLPPPMFWGRRRAPPPSQLCQAGPPSANVDPSVHGLPAGMMGFPNGGDLMYSAPNSRLSGGDSCFNAGENDEEPSASDEVGYFIDEKGDFSSANFKNAAGLPAEKKRLHNPGIKEPQVTYLLDAVMTYNGEAAAFYRVQKRLPKLYIAYNMRGRQVACGQCARMGQAFCSHGHLCQNGDRKNPLNPWAQNMIRRFGWLACIRSGIIKADEFNWNQKAVSMPGLEVHGEEDDDEDEGFPDGFIPLIGGIRRKIVNEVKSETRPEKDQGGKLLKKKEEDIAHPRILSIAPGVTPESYRFMLRRKRRELFAAEGETEEPKSSPEKSKVKSELPDLLAWAKSITDHIPYENLENTTGHYDRLQGAMRKVGGGGNGKSHP